MYFDDTWIRRLGQRRQRGAHINIDLWNFYQSVMNSKPQTMPLKNGITPSIKIYRIPKSSSCIDKEIYQVRYLIDIRAT